MHFACFANERTFRGVAPTNIRRIIMIRVRQRLLSGLLAIIMVAGMFTFFPLVTEVAAAGRVITWSGDALKYAMAYRDSDNDLSLPDTVSGITASYTGGKKNMWSGLYNNVSDSGAVTKHIRFNDGTGALSFTSATGNAFITKIVINYDR